MNSKIFKCSLSLAVILCLACAAVALAQVKTATTEQKGAVKHQAVVERGQVVYVAGNELVVKMENGEIRHFTVPDGAKAMVDGKEVTLKDLKPGMKLERTLTVTTTEKTVKTVKTVTGTVVRVNPPLSVVLQFEDNSVQQFKIPKDQVFMIDGQEKTAFDLRKGMKVTATRITEEPAVEVSQSKKITGSAAAPETPPVEGALLIAQGPPKMPAAEKAGEAPKPPAEPAASAEPTPKKLPKTGSLVPLAGLLGLLFSGAGIGVKLLRRS